MYYYQIEKFTNLLLFLLANVIIAPTTINNPNISVINSPINNPFYC